MEEKREERESLRYSRDVSADELHDAEEYLCSYRHGARILDCMKYGREFMGSEVLPEDPLLDLYEDADSDEELIRARMFGVRRFVNELKCDGNARLLLYWHYIRGVSVTRCAEIIGVSRAGAFRVRKRALEAAARALRGMRSRAGLDGIMSF